MFQVAVKSEDAFFHGALTPSTVQPDATCPKCGQVVEKGLIPGMTRPADAAPATGIPWHLKLLLIAFAIYLSWRFFQMLSWVL